MTTALSTLPLRLAAGLALAAMLAPAPALAQETPAEARLRKIEAEVRALQRKVFPGGDSRFFEPQITAGSEPAAPASVNPPATTAVTDILVRLDALERQIQTLTARSEEQANALGLIEARLVAIETRQGAGLVLPGGDAGTSGAGQPASPPPADAASAAALPAAPARPAFAAAPQPTQPPAQQPAQQPARQTAAQPAPPPAAAPSPERLAAVQQIAKPQTADAGDDEYSYGFRLWNAGFFPEARQQLTRFVEQYPSHWRLTYGRNLLGRAFLDDNMPEEAARWFLRNYQADRAGERAPDSLLYLAASMIAMNDTRRACIALAEFGETYPAVAAGRLADEYRANRAKVTCE